jgi:tetratricopeptide (TPR) repeat protein
MAILKTIKSLLLLLALSSSYFKIHPTIILMGWGLLSLLICAAIVCAGMYWIALYHHKQGRLLLAKGDLNGAIKRFNSALKLHDYAPAYFDRGVAKKANGDAEGANTDFAKAIELQPRLGLKETPSVTSLRSGYSTFQDLPIDVQQKLLNRQTNKETNQYILPLFSPRLTVVSGVMLFVIYWMCIYDVIERTMAQPDLFESAVALCFPTLLFYLLLSRFFKSIASPLKRCIYLTPLYLIRTNYREIWYWPIREILNIRVSTLVGPLFGCTLAQLTIETITGEVWETTLLRETHPNELIDQLQAFQLREASEPANSSFLVKENDFKSVVPSPFYKTKIPPVYRIASVGIPLLTALLFFLYAWSTVAFPSN